MSTADWLSSAVLNTWLRRAGMVVLRSITLVITPPSVSTPSDSGVTSSRRTSLTSPLMMAAWTAAPTATTSSGLTVMFGSLPPVRRRTRFCTAGILVEPPTRITSSMSAAVTLASLMACWTGPRQRSTRSAVACSKVERMIVVTRCLGPLASAVMKGRLTWVWVTEDSSTLAFSAASNRRCSAWGSWRRSIPLSRWNSSAKQVDEATVEVVTAEVGVARRGPHLDHAVADVEDADVERATAKVENEHGLVGPFVHAIGEGGGRRFVDDAEHFEPGDPARVLGCLPLGVVEVGGHGDDRLGHPLAQELGCVVDELSQHQGRDLLRCVELAVNGEPDSPVRARDHVEGDRLQLALDLVVAPADEALGGVDSALRVQDRLPTGQLTDQALALLGERHHRWRRP